MFDGGKHVSSSLRNLLMSVLTSLLYSGFNHVLFPFLLRFSSVVLALLFSVDLYFDLNEHSFLCSDLDM